MDLDVEVSQIIVRSERPHDERSLEDQEGIVVAEVWCNLAAGPRAIEDRPGRTGANVHHRPLQFMELRFAMGCSQDLEEQGPNPSIGEDGQKTREEFPEIASQ